MTRLDWMVERIVRAQGLADDPEVRRRLAEAMVQAFSQPIRTEPGLGEEGWKAGWEAYQTVSKMVEQIIAEQSR